MKAHILCLLILLTGSCFSQTILEDSVYFEQTQSYRNYAVWLPEDYDSAQTYHTIYCLDADLLFHPLVANVELYAYPEVGLLPPSIVIGLYFDQRNDDMGIDWKKGLLNETGHAFKDMIVEKLVPKIEANYNTASYRTIVGHSNSSTFIQQYLWDEAPAFHGYLSVSEFLLPTDSANICSIDAFPTPIDFVMVSASEDAPYRTKSGTQHEQLWEYCAPKNVRVAHVLLDGANHLTMVARGFPIGLEHLYEPYASVEFSDSLLALQPMHRSPLEIVDSMVSKRAEYYGLQETYTFADLNNLYNLYTQRKDSIHLTNATRKYAEMFNDSSEYFYEAQHLEMMHAYRSAEQSYLRHMEYYPAPGYWSYTRITWLYLYKLKEYENALNWALKGLESQEDAAFIELIAECVERTPKLRKRASKAMKDMQKTCESEEIRNAISGQLEAY